MQARIFQLRPENQINLDDVFPGLREKFSDERVYVEADLFETLRELHGDDLRDEMRDILKYFLEQNGPSMSIKGGNLPEEGLEFFLDDNLDEEEKKYHMLLLKTSKD